MAMRLAVVGMFSPLRIFFEVTVSPQLRCSTGLIPARTLMELSIEMWHELYMTVEVQ